MGRTLRNGRQVLSSVLLSLSVLVSSHAVQADRPVPAATSDQVMAAVLSLPLQFEPNNGQADSAVRYLARSAGYQAFLTDDDPVILFEPRRESGQSPALGGHAPPAAIRLNIVGGMTPSAIEPSNPLLTKTSYFGDASAVTDVPNYARVTYRGVYPGIDIAYYGTQGQLEFDFIVAPKVDPKSIRFRLLGARSLRVGKDGELSFQVSAQQDAVLRKPIAFQGDGPDRKDVDVTYALYENEEIGFKLGKYDNGQALTIDPILSYSTFLWGIAQDVAVDASGHAYVTGSITTGGLPATGGFQNKLSGYRDAYVLKLSPSGTSIIYATYLGVRRASSSGARVAVDDSGNAYVLGTTDSASFPTTAGAYRTTFTGSSGATFLAKLNSSGNGLLYSTFITGLDGKGLAIDSSGRAVIAGASSGSAPALVATPGAYASSGAGALARLSVSGASVDSATYFPEAISAVALDGSDNAYVTGSTSATDFPVVDAVQPTLGGSQDAYVSKINPSGTALLYSTFIGGSRKEVGNAIAVTPEGEAVIGGFSYSDNLPTTFAAFQPEKAYPGSVVSNGFVSKLSANGNALVYSSYIGGRWCLTVGVYSCFGGNPDGIDSVTAIAVDAAGYAYLGGHATSAEFPLVDGVQGPRPGGDDWRAPYLAKVAPNGERLVYSVSLGKRGQDEAVHGVAVGPDGAGYAVGHIEYARGVFPTTAGMPHVIDDSFIFKIDHGQYSTLLQSNPNPVQVGQSVVLTATVLNPQPGGSVRFMNGTVELGNASVGNGVATLVAQLPAGRHTITAIYSLDGRVSRPVYQVVTTQ